MAAPSDNQQQAQAKEDVAESESPQRQENLEAVIENMKQRESKMIKALIDSRSLIAIPYSTLKPLLVEHFGFRGAAKQVYEQIEERLVDGFYNQLGNGGPAGCFFNFGQFSKDLELLVFMTKNERWAIRLIIQAHNHQEMNHVAHCHRCRQHQRNIIQLQLIEAVEKEVPHLAQAEVRRSLAKTGRDIYQKFVNLLFADVMAKIVVALAKSTAELLAHRVAGHILPPELLELIAEYYQHSITEQMDERQADVSEAEGSGRYAGITDQDWSRRFTVLT